MIGHWLFFGLVIGLLFVFIRDIVCVMCKVVTNVFVDAIYIRYGTIGFILGGISYFLWRI